MARGYSRQKNKKQRRHILVFAPLKRVWSNRVDVERSCIAKAIFSEVMASSSSNESRALLCRLVILAGLFSLRTRTESVLSISFKKDFGKKCKF